jgi:hypothetical protein
MKGIFVNLTADNGSLSPIWRGFAPGFVNYKKGWTRLAATIDKAYQLLGHGRWFSPGTLASSTTKTSHHDIAEILLKVALNANCFVAILFCIIRKFIFLDPTNREIHHAQPNHTFPISWKLNLNSLWSLKVDMML